MNKAFSLLELSIVLVIIGLIAGGIVAGSSMIRAAELRAVITEMTKFQTSTHTFRDKYMGLPGDLKNATDFWGAAHATPATCLTTAGTGTQTCDGNGDNQLNYAANNDEYGEAFTFWQHLANAGLIEGTYTGRSGSLGWANPNNDNSYNSKLQGGVWYAFNMTPYGTLSGHSTFYDGLHTENFIQFAGINPSVSSSPDVSLLSPEETWNIDKKIDDGRPAYGRFRERHWNDCTDAATSADLDSDYLLSEKSFVCLPYLYGAF